MTLQEKEAFKKSIEEQIEALGTELARIEKALYPEKGEGPSDKVAHLN
ncbi:MAG TPA: molecular chaperone DnaK, partial [Nitratifractor salsuginis]|nr:molecular chaperone DnaK [Nitratifractor salsuginis]